MEGKMDKSFIHEFNEFEVRNTKKCRCKICDKELNNEKIIYLNRSDYKVNHSIYVFLVGKN
jgi:hypothetical protein